MTEGPHAMTVVSGLLAGLAVFLYGMDRLTSSLNALAGPQLTRWLAAVTQNRVKAAATGALVTAILQSSSLTTVLCVGFISAGFMTLKQAAGVILGANVGTTMTAQVFAFDITRLTQPLLIAGMALRLIAGNKKYRQLGGGLFGLGLLFFGMLLMSQATSPLREVPEFIEAMKSLRSPLLGLLAGAVFTALVQSSSATTGLVIVLSSQGAVSLQAGLALVLGANVGTCFTAVLAALGKSRLALQTALLHVCFNLVGALIWLPFLEQLGGAARALSPPGDLPRQIANAHTLFNLSNAFLFLAFTDRLAALVAWLVPQPEPVESRHQALYLDPSHLEVPALALERLHLEIVRFGEGLVGDLKAPPGEEHLERLRKNLTLHDQLLGYMARLHQQELERALVLRLQRDLVIANALHTIGQVSVNEILPQSRGLLERGGCTAEFLGSVDALADEAIACLSLAISAFGANDLLKAGAVLERKGIVREHRDTALALAMAELREDDPQLLEQFRLCSGLVDEWRRVYYFASRISHTLLRKDPD